MSGSLGVTCAAQLNNKLYNMLTLHDFFLKKIESSIARQSSSQNEIFDCLHVFSVKKPF
jgi:hypothetical protein